MNNNYALDYIVAESGLMKEKYEMQLKHKLRQLEEELNDRGILLSSINRDESIRLINEETEIFLDELKLAIDNYIDKYPISKKQMKSIQETVASKVMDSIAFRIDDFLVGYKDIGIGKNSGEYREELMLIFQSKLDRHFLSITNKNDDINKLNNKNRNKDNLRWLVTTGISIVALVVSVISLLK